MKPHHISLSNNASFICISWANLPNSPLGGKETKNLSCSYERIEKLLTSFCLRFIYKRPQYKARFNVTREVLPMESYIFITSAFYLRKWSKARGLTNQFVLQVAIRKINTEKIKSKQNPNTITPTKPSCVQSRKWHWKSIRFWKKRGKG